MKKAMSYAKEFFHRADIFLLVMGLICAIFGIVVISSATASYHSAKYVIVQSASLILGVFAFVVMTVLDVDVLADKWQILCAFNVVFLLLLIPFGVSDNTGNTGWLRFFGIGIQPTEVVKLTFIIILAKQISYLKEYHDLNSVWSVAQLAGHFVLLFGLILVVSSDLGSALIFFSIFLVMLFAAGFALHWFAIGFAAIAAMIPLLWKFVLHDYQKNRILAPYDSSIDPTNTGINWQPHQSKIALASGQWTGAGLGHGTQSQSNALAGKHTDFIYAVIGEELGMIACILVIMLLLIIIIRCVMVGIRSGSNMGSLVCFGVAAFLTFQTFENIGMCIGITPVIGITLPFFSYGGSSLFTTFAALGMVSGIHFRPRPKRNSIYYSRTAPPQASRETCGGVFCGHTESTRPNGRVLSAKHRRGKNRSSRVVSAAVTGGAVMLCKRRGVVGDAVFVVVVLHGRLDRFLREHGAVDLLGRQAVERLHDRLVGQCQRLRDGLAFDHLGRHRRGRDRAAAAERVELHVRDDAVVYLDIHPHDVAALGVADFTDAVSVGHLANVAGVFKMVHDLFAVQCHRKASFISILCQIRCGRAPVSSSSHTGEMLRR